MASEENFKRSIREAWQKQSRLKPSGPIFPNDEPHAQLSLGSRVTATELGEVGIIVGWKHNGKNHYDCTGGLRSNGVVRILFDKLPAKATNNPWNVRAKCVVFTDPPTTDPPVMMYSYKPPPPGSSDDPANKDTRDTRNRQNVAHLELLIQQITAKVEPETLEMSFSIPLFVEGKPHPNLDVGARVRDVRYGVSGTLIGWKYSGCQTGILEGAESSNRNVARVNFDQGHPEMMKIQGYAHRPGGRPWTVPTDSLEFEASEVCFDELSLKLLRAASEGHTDAVTSLLAASSVTLSMVEASGVRAMPLFMACHFGHEGCVRKLLQAGAVVNSTSHKGRSPLFAACRSGYEKCASLLIDQRADVNRRDEYGFTALAAASTKQRLQCVRLLLSEGADPNIPEAVGPSAMTPLMILACAPKGAMALGSPGWQCLQALSANADLHIKSGVASMNALCLAAMLGREEETRLLLDSKADCEQGDNADDFPLALAAYHGQQKTVRLLLAHKPDTAAHISSKGGNTAISFACQFDEAGCVREIVAGGGDPNLKRGDGRRPLLIAIYNNSLGSIKELIAAHANLAFLDTEGESALAMACRRGNPDVLKLLLSHPKASAFIDETDSNGATPLSWACQNGSGLMVEMLLRAGADREKPNRKGGTPLALAIVNDGVQCVEILLEAGAKLEPLDAILQADPLAFVVQRHSIAVAALLLARNANVNAVDGSGHSVLHTACSMSSPRMVRLLLEHGASPEHLLKRRSSSWSKECQELLSNAKDIHTQAKEKRLMEHAEREREHQQRVLLEWLQHACGMDLLESAKVRSALSGLGYAWDSVAKVKMLVTTGGQDMWPPEIAAAQKSAIIQAVMKKADVPLPSPSTTQGAVVYSAPPASPSKAAAAASFEDTWQFSYEKLVFGRELGAGGFSQVYEVLVAGTLMAAKKFMFITQRERAIAEKMLHRELRVLRKVNHENVIKLLGVCLDDPDGRSMLLVMELSPLGSVRTMLDSDTENAQQPQIVGVAEVQRQLLLGIARGMAFLHSLEPRPILHHDLKPANVLVFRTETGRPGLRPKLCDFGLATGIGGNTSRSGVQSGTAGGGTLNYQAPEMYEADAQFTTLCEVYAFGILGSEILTGALPWPEGWLQTQLYTAVVVNQARPSLQTVTGTSERLIPLVERCWAHEARNRPSFSQICEAAELKPESALRDSMMLLSRKLGIDVCIEPAGPDGKFVFPTKSSEISLVHMGRPSTAAAGLARGLLFVSDYFLGQGLMDGVAAMQREFEAHGTDLDRLLLDYVLNAEAGSVTKPFQDGLMLDRSKDGELLHERIVQDENTGELRGMRLADFVKHHNARIAQLDEAHVAALRLYSTAAFRSINGPLRDKARLEAQQPHKLPVTVNLIDAAIRRLRLIEGQGAARTGNVDLYRGMRDVQLPADFMRDGLTEFAPISTTSSLEVAMQYSASSSSVLLRLRSDNFFKHGLDISWLSAFPHECEVLFPPLTHLHPTGGTEHVSLGEANFLVVDVSTDFFSA